MACTQLVDLSDLAGPPSSPSDAGPEEASASEDVDASAALDATNVTDVQIAEERDAGPDFDNGLVVYFPLDEGMGTIVTDVTSRGLQGSVVGSPVWVDGKFGKAIELDGVASHVDTLASNAFDFGVGEFTVAAWVRFANIDGGLAAFSTIVSRGLAGACCQDAGYPGFALGSVSSVLQIRIEDEASGLNTILAGVTLPPAGVWVHAVGVRSATTLGFYLNGVRLADKPIPVGYSVNGSGESLMLGASPGFPTGRFFSGAIDDVRIYDRALSDVEVAALYRYQP